MVMSFHALCLQFVKLSGAQVLAGSRAAPRSCPAVSCSLFEAIELIPRPGGNANALGRAIVTHGTSEARPTIGVGHVLALLQDKAGRGRGPGNAHVCARTSDGEPR